MTVKWMRLKGLMRPYFSFWDYDGDGDLDLLTGSDTGITALFPNTGASSSFEKMVGNGFNPLHGVTLGATTSGGVKATCYDFDGDGDRDCTMLNNAGHFLYFKNTGTPYKPVLTLVPPAQGPFGSLGNFGASLGEIFSSGQISYT